MVSVIVGDYDAWRREARRLLTAAVSPETVLWLDAADPSALPFAADRESGPDPTPERQLRVPRRFHTLAEVAACHRNTAKWSVMYRVLWRVVRDRQVLEQETDSDVRALNDMAAQVKRDEHKMRAFVRFVPVTDDEGTRYVAWYAPDHLIVRRAAPFFAERFASMRWSILTPDESVHWDDGVLSFGEGVAKSAALNSGSDDEIEALWRVYYASVFNPARVNPRAMQREMPARRWRELPEGAIIPQLVSSAHDRTERLIETRAEPTARPFVPATDDLDALRAAAAQCRGCALHAAATQVVFGEGPATASLFIVGEQPGDSEDRRGRPFVGPAGEVLDRALAAAGIDRDRVYLTNAVKHFSFEPRGKWRIHKTPRQSEMYACRPWLEEELRIVRPATVVALGATAARALLGPQARVMSLRGQVIERTAWAPRLIVSVHPSAVLRAEEGQGDKYFEMLVQDLTLARSNPPVA